MEIQKDYQNEPRFNGVYSRDNLPDKIKNWAYVINLDEFVILELIGLLCMHWMMLLILIVLEMKQIKTNIFRIQAHDSVMWGYSCIAFIDFILAGKTLTDFTNLFSPNNFKKNDMILKYFMTTV